MLQLFWIVIISDLLLLLSSVATPLLSGTGISDFSVEFLTVVSTVFWSAEFVVPFLGTDDSIIVI